MEHYIGLDVSLKATSVCIVDKEGKIHSESKVSSHPDIIATHIKRTGLQIAKVGLEAGQLSSWLCKGLSAAGLPVVCVEPRHMHHALKAQHVKTDRNDARGIAHMLRMNWYKAVHIKSDSSEQIRTVLTSRKHLQDGCTRTRNHIRGVLKVYGIKLGNVGRLHYFSRVMEKITKSGIPLLDISIRPLLESLEAMHIQMKVLDKQARKLAREDKVCKRLMTIPGIGQINALAFRVTVDDPLRFKQSRQVGSHFGITPRKYASGEVDYDGRITKCGDGLVRSCLYEAANVVLTRMKKECHLKDWALRIEQRSSRRKATVALARRLSVLMHRIWINGTTYEERFVAGASGCGLATAL